MDSFPLFSPVIPTIQELVFPFLGSGPCEKYTVLDSVDRSVGYSKQNQIHCDWRDISKGWYRFMGAAGNMMPTSCVPMNRCGTHAPGWLKSRHPTLYQGIVIGQVCYHWQALARHLLPMGKQHQNQKLWYLFCVRIGEGKRM